jgi:hypothetical protein
VNCEVLEGEILDACEVALQNSLIAVVDAGGVAAELVTEPMRDAFRAGFMLGAKWAGERISQEFALS